jgi:hypothetical protein
MEVIMFLLLHENNIVIDAVDTHEQIMCSLKVTRNGREYKYINCAQTFVIIEVQENDIPGDFVGRKYFYNNGTFVLNPDY